MTETKKSNTRSSVLSYEDVSAVSPALEHYTKGPLLDGLWKRPELSPRDRSVVTVAALIARIQTVDAERHGRFYRLIPLPDGAKIDDAKANFKNGVLEINVPVTESETKRHQIPIGTSGQNQAKAAGR